MQLNTWRNFTRYVWVSCGGKGCSIISSSDCAKRAWRRRRVRREAYICTCPGAACSCIHWRQTKTRLVQLEALLLRCCCPSAIVSSKIPPKKKKVWQKQTQYTRQDNKEDRHPPNNATKAYHPHKPHLFLLVLHANHNQKARWVWQRTWIRFSRWALS